LLTRRWDQRHAFLLTCSYFSKQNRKTKKKLLFVCLFRTNQFFFNTNQSDHKTSVFEAGTTQLSASFWRGSPAHMDPVTKLTLKVYLYLDLTKCHDLKRGKFVITGKCTYIGDLIQCNGEY
jgi:hypothetical protein